MREVFTQKVVTPRNTRVRGSWHFSPFLRALMKSKKLQDHFSKIIGEPVVPQSYERVFTQYFPGKIKNNLTMTQIFDLNSLDVMLI